MRNIQNPGGSKQLQEPQLSSAIEREKDRERERERERESAPAHEKTSATMTLTHQNAQGRRYHADGNVSDHPLPRKHIHR